MRKNKIIAMLAASAMLLTAIPVNSFAKFMFVKYPMLVSSVPYTEEPTTDVSLSNEEQAALHDQEIVDLAKDLKDYTFEDLIAMTDEEVCAISKRVHKFFNGAYPYSSQQIGYGRDSLEFYMWISENNPYYDEESRRDFNPVVILNDLGLPSELLVEDGGLSSSIINYVGEKAIQCDEGFFCLKYKDYPLEFLYPRIKLMILKNKLDPENPINGLEYFTFEIVPYGESRVSVLSGDVDGDGEVTLTDAVAAASYIADPAKYPLDFKQQAAADAADYGDGVNAADVVAIQRYLLEDVEDLPVSYAE